LRFIPIALQSPGTEKEAEDGMVGRTIGRTLAEEKDREAGRADVLLPATAIGRMTREDEDEKEEVAAVIVAVVAVDGWVGCLPRMDCARAATAALFLPSSSLSALPGAAAVAVDGCLLLRSDSAVRCILRAADGLLSEEVELASV